MVSVHVCERGTRPQIGGKGVCVCVCVSRVEIETDQRKKHAGWVFVIASSPRWMAAAAVRADSCRPERMGKNKLQEGRRERWGESRAACERLRNVASWKSARGFRNRFYWKAHLLAGPFPRVPARLSSRQEGFGGALLSSNKKQNRQCLLTFVMSDI